MNAVDIIKYFETHYPTELAYEWDNVGLQVGTLNHKTERVLVTLDVTKEVVKEAIQKKVNLILSHHPLMFKPMQNIVFDSPKGWIVKNLIQHNIAVYSAHTNFDVADGGMNDLLAAKIGIQNPKLMDEVDNIGRYGSIEKVPFQFFVQNIKQLFDLEHVKVIGRDDRDVSIVGISGGSGSHHMYAAKKRGCDVYITGDITYHTALDAIQLGMTLLDVGHHIEIIFVESVRQMLLKQFPDVEFIASEIDTNPYKPY
ncbi:MAG: Nif3-like dinuclear metal center hexameric protein [Bacilli bacterium]|nr:Nif3-like dinuclear metal center hexameric protein [Bacilli bacterium]MBN2877936.1 Nif3-like dinuclear metal center hexameric protein [Bacilli bacterium]